MIFLLNLLMALIAGFLTDYVLTRAGAKTPLPILIAVLVGVIVFLVNPAAQIV